ncbi:MAG: polysaccharide pyruvyl transferase CsaB [Deltaproteobacteria bacterium]
MKKVLISGYYGFGNTGDEAILETLSNEFSKSNIKAEVLSSNPQKTQKAYGVKAYKRSNLQEIVKAIKNCDAVISGGGSLFQDVTSSGSLYYYLGIVIIAQVLGKKIHIFSQGIGPVKKELNRKIFAKIINRVETISVRDQISLEELAWLGVNKPKQMLTNDPVFMLQPASKDTGRKILQEAGVESEGKLTIGIAARSWNNNNDSISQIAEIINQIIKEFDANVVMFPFHYPEDLDFAYKIAEKTQNKPYILKEEYKPSEIMSAIGLMDINIGVRLHSLIFSVCMGVPVIGITYDPKIDGFLKEIGLRPVCNYDNMQCELIIKEIKRIIDNKDEILNKIMEAKGFASNKVFDNFNKLIGEVNNG